MNKKQVVLDVIAKALKIKSVNEGCTVNFIGIDIPKSKKISKALYENFDIEIKADEICKLNTLRDIVNIVVSSGNFKESDSINEDESCNDVFSLLQDFVSWSKFGVGVLHFSEASLGRNRQFHQLDIDDEFYYIREDIGWWSGDVNWSFVITNLGVQFKNNNLVSLSWEELSNIEYKEEFFYFFTSNDRTKYESIYYGYIVPYEVLSGERVKFAKVLSAIATNFVNQREIDFNRINDLIDQEDYDAAIDYAKQLENKYSDTPYWYLLWAKSMVFRYENTDEVKQELTDALIIINKGIDLAIEIWTGDNYLLYVPEYYLIKGYILLYLNQILEARDNIIRAMESNDENIKEVALNIFKKIDSEFASIYLDCEYKDRKLLMPLKNISGCLDDDIKTFEINNLPKCINFPIGHPVANELYIGHPYNSSTYIPYKESEFTFFLDKINEYCYLLQCLGAIEISITSQKGKSINELNNNSKKVEGDASFKVVSGNSTYSDKIINEKDLNTNEKLSLVQKFNPILMPYIPDDLVWFPNEVGWQRLTQQRFSGNMLEYHQMISTNETKFVASNQEQEVKASVKGLWNKANVSYQGDIDSKFRKSVETEWMINVKFKSIDEFQDTSTCLQKKINISNFNDAEIAYKEEVLFSLEDDQIISDEERRFLERKRLKLNLSVERAMEIEKIYIKELFTKEEKEFLEELKEVAVDGIIPNNARRLLNRFRESLMISEERGKELEIIFRNE